MFYALSDDHVLFSGMLPFALCFFPLNLTVWLALAVVLFCMRRDRMLCELENC